MKQVLSFFLFVSCLSSFGSGSDGISEVLSKMDKQLRFSNSLEMKYTTVVKNQLDGSETITHSEYYKKGSQYYRKQGSVISIQNTQLKVAVDDEMNKLIVANVGENANPDIVDFQKSLEMCESSSLTDTLGMKMMRLEFGSQSALNHMILWIKDDLPTKLVLKMQDAESNMDVTINYTHVKVNTTISNKKFDTSQYIQEIKGEYISTDPYKNYKLYNLIKA